MAHTCPHCGQYCHCGGDIDDICFGEKLTCTCCYGDDEEDDDFYDDWDDNDHPLNPPIKQTEN